MKIIVAHHEECTRHFLHSVLSAKGEVVSCSSSESMVRLASTGEFALAIMNTRLPIMSMEEAIRAMKKASNIKVVVASGVPNTRERALSAGADSFIELPSKIEELEREILSVLGE